MKPQRKTNIRKDQRTMQLRLIGWGYTPDLNSREKAEQVLARYAEMGLSGAKLDFFDHHPFTGNKRTRDFEGTQTSLKMRDYLMQIAVKRHLVLEFEEACGLAWEFRTAAGTSARRRRTRSVAC